MDNKNRMSYGELEAELLDAIKKLPVEDCKELLLKVTSAILERTKLSDIAATMAKTKPDETLEKSVSRLLTLLGMPTHIKGYPYTKEAVLFLYEYRRKQGHSCSMTKELYPHIAKRFNTGSSRVERAIRHAVEVTWDRGDIEVLKEIFGYTVSGNKGKPTNSEFLSMLDS